MFPSADGACLHTISLRPNVMYGEGDPYYIPNALQDAKRNGGVLTRVGNSEALFQQVTISLWLSKNACRHFSGENRTHLSPLETFFILNGGIECTICKVFDGVLSKTLGTALGNMFAL